jgi:hypothetical protein
MLYEAAFDAEEWPPFLTALAQALEGTLPTLFLHDTRAHSGAVAINVGYDAGIVCAYKKHFADRNPWLRSRTHVSTPGSVRTHTMCLRTALLGSEDQATELAVLAAEIQATTIISVTPTLAAMA